MLKSTFCHIPGIGHATEKKLWNAGICNWQDLLDSPDSVKRVSSQDILSILESSLKALATTPNYFTRLLKNHDHWRLFPHFREKTAYLDIETSGLGHDAEITAIALYDGIEVRTYVNGRNLDDFLEDIDSFQVLVSYNGISFDIPFIERFFGITLAQAQIDLRFVLAKLGCRGGLKGCERQFGINRGMLDGVDGSFAVTLWNHYQRYNDEKALETLLAYNVEDTVNLERLMVEAYNRNVDMIPFGRTLVLPFPQLPRLDHHPDPDILAQYRTRYPL